MLTKDPKDDGIVITEEMMQQAERELKPNELPDPVEIAEVVGNILEYMCEDEVLEVQKENYAAYEDMLEKKFPDFANRYRAIFNLTISGENIDMLMKMLESLGEIKAGEKKMDEVKKELQNELAETYIYANLSDKDLKKIKKKMRIV